MHSEGFKNYFTQDEFFDEEEFEIRKGTRWVLTPCVQEKVYGWRKDKRRKKEKLGRNRGYLSIFVVNLDQMQNFRIQGQPLLGEM